MTFGLLAIGAIVLTVNIILLGGTIVFFQSLCLLGYCLFPLVVAAAITAIFENNVMNNSLRFDGLFVVGQMAVHNHRPCLGYCSILSICDGSLTSWTTCFGCLSCGVDVSLCQLDDHCNVTKELRCKFKKQTFLTQSDINVHLTSHHDTNRNNCAIW